MTRHKKTTDGDDGHGAMRAESGPGEPGAGDGAGANGHKPPEATLSGDDSGVPELPPATPEERIAALESERNEIKDRMLRLAADFENAKKRGRKEQEDAVAQAREQVLKEMLDVIDNLERAVAMQAAGANGAVDVASVLKGVNLVLRLFQQKLERFGVQPFEAKGQPFDPRQHEAISRVESTDVPSGAVAVELQKGYKIGERLLRPAMVSVSTGPKPSGG